MPSDSFRYYFVSDVHLGAGKDGGKAREEKFVSFLKSLPEETESLFLLGDIFDFWVEYKDVVPRGFTRVFGALAELADRGCKVYFFKGNHDYWVTDYFEKELGITVVDEPYRIFDICGRRFCIGHGDVLNVSDWKARLIFHLFRNEFLIRLLKAVPVHLMFKFAHGWSAKSRKGNADYRFNVEGSDILKFAQEIGRQQKIDYFIFGHYHHATHCDVEGGGELYLLDDWALSANFLYFSGTGISGLGFPNMNI
ncbi:MAG: UDP-2,3-diacylglucosamine diphosphatase [Bacteroidales bacterium]|nr:UDP-2,3-diacylglucosamine diphosphatase [Candidatus Cacconaster merdequi]